MRRITTSRCSAAPTAIDDLYLCGASCHPGPGVVFLPGYNSAHVVLEDLGIEVARPV
ncbi:MAG: hypothetical protein JRH10_02610 [Deltaproteobacteria bacterium]|nr:hypothetical protein [Deltaproteobacteria bacterium]MBW2448008.1 hypothetical protein [Deltaproteobacteria bacterium]